MPVQALAPGYRGEKRDRPENFHGNLVFYFNWVDHLMFCAPIAFPLSPDMKLGDAVKHVISTAYSLHPDWEKIDWSTVKWELNRQPIVGDFNKSFKELGADHKSVFRFTTPGLTGIKGSFS